MLRSEIPTTMSTLKLYGSEGRPAIGPRAAPNAAYDEVLATAVKRQHEPEHVGGDLLAAEISEK